MQLNYLIKSLIIICAITFFSNSTSKLYAQANTWTKKADFGGTARSAATGFAIGTKGYIGTGYDGFVYKKDFWEYDPVTNVWTQRADFGGTARSVATGFAIGTKGYIGTGYDGIDRNDFWEYDPGNNVWVQKADFGGIARSGATGFAIGTKGYIGTGYIAANAFDVKDFWEYDPATNVWVQKADVGGTVRDGAAGFAIGTKGYIGTGTDSDFFGASDYKDFWEYDPGTNIWTQKADFGGTVRDGAAGFAIGTKGYIGTGRPSLGAVTYNKDFWEYDPGTNIWTQKADFGGTERSYATGFSIGTKGYIGAGYNGVHLQDFWEYSNGSVLPVTSISFTGKRVIHENELNWQIADEINVAYYFIERSRDGVNFSGFTDNRIAANNPLSKSYSFTDHFPFNNISFYRLKILDNDGRFKYSKIIAVKEETGNSLIVFPNPAKDILFIQVSGENHYASIQIFDAIGRKIKEEKMDGNISVSIDIKDVPPGIYTVLLKKNQLLTEKLQFIRQ